MTLINENQEAQMELKDFIASLDDDQLSAVDEAIQLLADYGIIDEEEAESMMQMGGMALEEEQMRMDNVPQRSLEEEAVEYLQVGGLVGAESPVGGPEAPVDVADTPGAPAAPAAPQAVTLTPPPTTPQPYVVQTPQPSPKMSLIDRVMEAKDALDGKASMMMLVDSAPAPLPAPTPVMGEPMVDETVHPGEPQGEDTVPAWLTPGEAVVPAEAVAENPELVGGLIDRGRDIQAMERGGMVYAQEGGLIDQAKPFLQGTSPNLPARGKIGQVAQFASSALAGKPDYSLISTTAEASDPTVGTKTWMDQDTKLKYKEVTRGGRTQYIGVHDGKALTDQGAISRLVLVGTEGSGAAKSEPPEKLMSKNLARRFGNALEDAKAGLLAGGGNIVDLLLARSVSAVEYGKIALAAKASGGSDEIFRVLNTVLGQAVIRSQPREDINNYYNFMHNVSNFEVIASQASGETRLTDEDAKRYLRAIVNPEATPESILVQLGRAAYEVMFEDRRRQSWLEYAAQAPGTQRTEYYFNVNVWNAEQDRLEAGRQQFIDNFVGEGWQGKPKGVTVDTVTLEGLEGNWAKIDEVPEDVEELHAVDNVGKEIQGDDGNFYVFTAKVGGALGVNAILPGTTQWYIREDSNG